MRKRLLAAPLAAALASALPGQDWTDDQLMAQVQGFLQESTVARLEQTASLLEHQQEAYSAICARIHGDHREYLLKIDRLLADLSDERWAVREEAERTLIEVGARARAMIQARVDNYSTLEESIRCRRILERIAERGTEQEEREIQILRGLVGTALYMAPQPRLLRALRSALGHTDPLVVDGALRALGKHGGDEEADAVAQLVDWKGGIYRAAALGALSRMRGDRALELCRELLSSDNLNRNELIGMIRNLRLRGGKAAELIKAMTQHPDPIVAAAAALEMPAAGEATSAVRLLLADRSPLDARFQGFVGDSIRIAGPVDGLPEAEIPFADCDILDFPEHESKAPTQSRVFLNQGSLVTGEVLVLDEQHLRLRSPVFGELTIPRDRIQGMALDPALDRLVGASSDHDRVRLKSNRFIDGRILRLGGGQVEVAKPDGTKEQIPLADIAGLLMTRPRMVEPDNSIYTRVDLVGGDRLLGYIAGIHRTHIGLVVPDCGGAVIPVEQVHHLELGVGGGALWGFTLIADYSDNKIVEIDDQGREVFVLDEVFGAWDVECLDSGNLLITEFSVSRVQEVTRQGEVVWVFEDLKNPYDADRLPNGNTLIADTFGSRVIEVNPKGEIVWQYNQEIRPFDVERLANGNTLIADVLKDRVLEVDPQGEVVWEVKNMPNAHDADRLPNGNTLITLRTVNKVVEVDRDGKVVFEIDNLNSPSDADRLPNGNTLVAENGMVREFDRRGNLVAKKEMTWAVEVNRY